MVQTGWKIVLFSFPIIHPVGAHISSEQRRTCILLTYLSKAWEDEWFWAMDIKFLLTTHFGCCRKITQQCGSVQAPGSTGLWLQAPALLLLSVPLGYSKPQFSCGANCFRRNITGVWGHIGLFLGGPLEYWWDFVGGLDGKESACNVRDLGLVPGSGRSPGEGNGYLLQYSCLENSMDRGYSSWGPKKLDTTERLSLQEYW